MIEAIFEIVFEIIIQGGAEIIAEVVTHKSRKRRRARGIEPKPMNPVVAAVLWFALGALMGGGSLIFFPHSFIHSEGLRIANLILTPLMLGAIMALIGRKRLANGEETVPLDKFSNAALFALGMAGVRFFFAH
ncbi:MAG: hypothetical protein K0R10_2024 [Alphaproteobacteria bacterium]|jgi:hypothetical protein|nr:hypothetical protein [Alphaproteobacteria bacterium]